MCPIDYCANLLDTPAEVPTVTDVRQASNLDREAKQMKTQAAAPKMEGSYGVVEFQSSSSDRVYETRLYGTGATSCDCPGWRYQRKPLADRQCKHTKAVRTTVWEG